MVNMVAIRQVPDDSLHNILDESPDAYSQGSIDTVSSCPPFLPGFGGWIFHISHDSITKDGETAKSAMLA